MGHEAYCRPSQRIRSILETNCMFLDGVNLPGGKLKEDGGHMPFQSAPSY